ncbi:uncharacterized protein Dvir_GJ26569 [Drosophila virilis]|uniref:C-type lectin domain-containing protein n=1 Tax=Drosophila virilis TaxID=7244 RepID=A0A0Q9WCV8_DROVI|nr:uncharacterized protein Dvir_GJ26569 [Drosophila virilis]
MCAIGLPINIDFTTAPVFYFFENATKRNCYDAFEQCRQMNATLISFEAVEEWCSIDRYRKSLGDENRYWTSGTDLAQEESHVWFAIGKPKNNNVWAADKPKNDGSKHCNELV